MKAILKREIKNFLKNPIFWAGLLIMVAGIYQILQPYLELHYFTSNAEIQNMSVSSLEDADVMEGYIPVSDEERTENGYEEIYRTMTEDMGLTTEEANEAISSIRGMNTEEACDYLEKEIRPQGCPSRSAVQQALNFIKSGQKPRNYAVSGVFPFQMV